VDEPEKDAEIEVLKAIVRAMASLSVHGRERVLAYLKARYLDVPAAPREI
jgi:hypothetical protein